MEPVKIIQPSFVAGELSPSLGGRVDLAKYRAGAATMENFLVQPQGGAINRPGFQFVAALPEPVRLIPFQFSVYQSYVLAFGNNSLYVIKNGGVVVGPGASVAVIVTPYAYADVASITFTQSADTLFLAHPNYPPFELQRSSDTDWTFTPLSFSVATPAPTGLTAQYVNGAPTTKTVLSIEYQVSTVNADGEESLPCTPVSVTVDYPWYTTGTVELNWTAVPGAQGYNVYKNSRGYFGLISTLTGNGAALANGTPLSGGDAAGHAAALAFDGNLLTYWQSSQAGSAAVNAAYIGQEFSSPQTVTGFRFNQGNQGGTGGPNVIALQSSADGVNWVTAQAFNTTPAENYWQQYYLLASVTAKYFRLLVQGVAGDRAFIVAELQFQGTTVTTSFIDDNIDEDDTNGPQTTQNPFIGAGNYPGAVGLFQERLFLASTNNQPNTIWATQTGLYNNMGISFPLKATDSLEVALNAQGVNAIKFMLPMNNLLLFCSDAEWVLGPGQSTDGITPTSIAANLQGFRGCAEIRPLAIGRCVLFVQRNNTVIREMDYSSYFSLFTSLFAVTNDVSVFANHLFDGYSLVEWAYQQTPYYTVWAVRNDGTLLGFTYIKEQQITAWHRHTTQGKFLSVASVDEGAGQTELYALVQRTVGGQTVYYVEKMFHRIPIGNANFLDCALAYSGTPQTRFTGANHLIGCTAGIVADGSVLPPQVVAADGSVTLSDAASNVCVGLTYTARLQTTKLEQEMQGTIQGRKQVMPRLVARFENSRGGRVGSRFDTLTPIPYYDDDNESGLPGLFTGDLINIVEPDWRRGLQVCVEQDDPLPISVLAVIPEMVVSEA